MEGHLKKKGKDKFLINILIPYISLSKKTIFTIIENSPKRLQGKTVMVLGLLYGAIQVAQNRRISCELSVNAVASKLYVKVRRKEVLNIWKILIFLQAMKLITLENNEKDNGFFLRKNEHNGKPYLCFTVKEVNIVALDENISILDKLDYEVIDTTLLDEGLNYLK